VELGAAGRRSRRKSPVSNFSERTSRALGGIAEGPVVAVSSRLALRLRALLPRPSRAACGPAWRVESRLREKHRRCAGPTVRTRFVVSRRELYASRPQAAGLASRVTSYVAHPVTGHGRVLVVDDQPRC
jgi:hypothetical protein